MVDRLSEPQRCKILGTALDLPASPNVVIDLLCEPSSGARLRKAPAPGTPLTVEAANAQAESVVLPPTLNDLGRWEREARRSPIAPPVAL
jgi:hypothetical protein